MHEAAATHGHVFGVVDDHLAQHIRILHSAAHEVCIFYIVTIVGESHSAVSGHVAHFRELLAFQVFGNRADDAHFHHAHFVDAAEHITKDRCIIDDRLRIGHGSHVGDTAGSSCLGTGVNVFLRFLSRFAEMDVHIDEARSHIEAGGIINFGAVCRNIFPDFFDLPILYQDVCDFMLLLRRVYDRTVFN